MLYYIYGIGIGIGIGMCNWDWDWDWELDGLVSWVYIIGYDKNIVGSEICWGKDMGI